MELTFLSVYEEKQNSWVKGSVFSCFFFFFSSSSLANVVLTWRESLKLRAFPSIGPNAMHAMSCSALHDDSSQGNSERQSCYATKMAKNQKSQNKLVNKQIIKKTNLFIHKQVKSQSFTERALLYPISFFLSLFLASWPHTSQIPSSCLGTQGPTKYIAHCYVNPEPRPLFPCIASSTYGACPPCSFCPPPFFLSFFLSYSLL